MKVRGVWIFLLGIVSMGMVACGNPFKVTDPSDPRFKPENFRFEDYAQSSSKVDVLRKLFPVGTSRGFVEEVLVNAGGAKTSNDEMYPSVHYLYDVWYRIDGSWNVTVYYNEAGKVSRLIWDGVDITIEIGSK